MFDQSRAAFDPIAVIIIFDASNIAHFGRVDMAAYDAFDAALSCRLGDEFFKTANELDRVFDLMLGDFR